MAHIHEGNLIGTGKRLGIVVSRYNEVITKALLEGALNHLRRSGVSESNIEVAWVPGAFEIPLALGEFAHQKKFDALIVLGCVIRGETSNYEHIAQTTTEHIARIMLEERIPIGFGLLTVESYDQAIARSGGKVGNKGREAAEAALEMTNLISELKQENDRTATEQIFSEARQGWSKNKF
ncbi:MAG: 6,7-dimethyl-8-ribityllumazine synthase [Candidatus Omnitrophica bacterium]|nr:6,7-dimethyl-8-ribityllumazine synthase [Candidatus Omnitrophota bacterium]